MRITNAGRIPCIQVGLLLCLLPVVGRPVRAAAFGSDHTATVSIPTTKFTLREGVSLSSGLGTGKLCVTGTEAPAQGQPVPQMSTARIKDETDASSYAQDLKISASAQAKFVLGGADFKMSYVTSHHFLQKDALFSVYATVEQQYFVAPSDTQGIALTDEAKRALDAGAEQFRQLCGEGFVATLVKGAELIGTIVAHDVSEDDATRLTSSMSFNLAGDGANGALDNSIQSGSQLHKLEMEIMQWGGSGNPIPTDRTSLLAAVGNLRSVATGPVPDLYAVVRDYTSLSNWPVGKHLPPPAPDPFDNIMKMYYRVDALMQQAAAINIAARSVPANAPPPAWQYVPDGFNWSANRIGTVFDGLSAARTTLYNEAQACDTSHQCDLRVAPLDVYRLAAALPMPWVAKTPAERDFESHYQAFTNFIFNWEVLKSRRVVDALMQFRQDPTCYQRNHYVTQLFEREGYPGNVRSTIDTYNHYLGQVPEPLRHDTVDFYIRRPQQAHCLASPTDPDCKITDSQIESIEASLPLSGRTVVTNFDPARTDTYGPCPGGVLQTPNLYITGWQ